jgi:UDP-N-acetylmuramoyl-tripeptide--D-alanyl-D-alanine ligase
VRQLFSSQEITDILNIEAPPQVGHAVSGIEVDSRRIQPGELFAALPGERNDGHQFISTAYELGVRSFLVSRQQPQQSFPSADFYLVDDVLLSMQRLAKEHRKRFPDTVFMALTGSNGKTTTKELLASILQMEGNSFTNEGNRNSDMGLPMELCRMEGSPRFALFEMGMNRRGEIAELADIVKPHIAAITNIGTAHIGMLGSQDAIFQEKSDIFSCFQEDDIAILPADSEYLPHLKEKIPGTWVLAGEGQPQTLELVEDRGLGGMLLRYKSTNIHLRLAGLHNFRNVQTAIAMAEAAGLSEQSISEGLTGFETLFWKR